MFEFVNWGRKIVGLYIFFSDKLNIIIYWKNEKNIYNSKISDEYCNSVLKMH